MWGAWLAQSVKHATLDPRVVSSSPMLGVDITYIHTYIHTLNDCVIEYNTNILVY